MRAVRGQHGRLTSGTWTNPSLTLGGGGEMDFTLPRQARPLLSCRGVRLGRKLPRGPGCGTFARSLDRKAGAAGGGAGPPPPGPCEEGRPGQGAAGAPLLFTAVYCKQSLPFTF